MAEKVTNNAETKKSEPQFSLEELREKSFSVFGITKPIFDGATYGMTGRYTVEKIKTVIEKWLKKEVK